MRNPDGFSLRPDRWLVILALALGLGFALTSTAQAQQTGDCAAGCAASIDDPSGDIVTGDTPNFRFFVDNRSEQQPIDGVGFVASELNCLEVPAGGGVTPGSSGTCCVRLACATGVNCAQSGVLSAFQLPGTFTGTTCSTSAPGLSCNAFDDNTVCLSGSTVIPAQTLLEVLSVDTVATNPVINDLEGNGVVGDFSSAMNTLNNYLVDVTIDGACTDDTGRGDNGSCQTVEAGNYPPVCGVQLDKQISCDGGISFEDVGFGDNTAGSCDGWNAFDGQPGESIIVRYVARPTPNADLDLNNCEITESNGGIGNPPAPGLIGLGGEYSFDDTDQVCSNTLAMGEPDTAEINCLCDTAEDNIKIPASDSDMADFECLDPSLNVSKQCVDTGADGAGDRASIDVFNDGTANLVGCELTDTLDINEPSATCPGDGVDTEVTVIPLGDLAPGMGFPKQIIDFGNRLTPSCNTASVTCTIDGTNKTITREDHFACAPLSCDVSLDKVLIVDGQRIDEGDIDVDVQNEGISWVGDDVEFEFIVANTGTANAECTVVDTTQTGTVLLNTVVSVPAGGTVVVPNPPPLSAACSADIAGIDTATLSCVCVDDLGDQVTVTDEDTASLQCLEGNLAVQKTCDDVNPQNGLSDSVNITVTNIGTANLVNCQVSDALDQDATCPSGDSDLLVTVGPQGFALAPTDPPQLVSGSFPEQTADSCNNVSVTCTIEGTDKTVTATDDAACTGGTCQVAFDKQVSCDGVNFVDDNGGNDPGNGAIRGCTSWNPHDSNGDGINDAAGEAADRRFVIDNNRGGTAAVRCSIDDLDGAGVTTFGPFDVPAGAVHVEDVPATCDPGTRGVSGVDTATLSCECLDQGAPSGRVPDPITPFVDQAEITCETPALEVSKLCEDQVNDRNAISITIQNTGDTPLENCVLSDPLAPECAGAPITSPIASGAGDTVACGVDGLLEDTLNTATVTCDIAGTDKRISDSDAALCMAAPESCELQVKKTCCIPPSPAPPAGAFDCSDAKPIQTLSLIWNGPTGTDLVSEGGQVINNLQNGQLYVLTVASLGNDVDVDLAFPDGTTGKSRFHVSCSDQAMNGPEDCFEPQGNGKDDRSEFDELWLLEGIAGSDLALVCTPPDPGPQNETSCQESGGSTGADCRGKVTRLVFEYTGAECQAMLPEGAKCSGNAGGASATIVALKDENLIEISPSTVVLGETFFYGPNAQDSNGQLASSIKLAVDGQQLEIHTSCSKPLNVGMEFGSLTLAEITTTKGGTITNEITPVQFLESCELSSPPPPHCTSKIKSLTFKYLGGDCSISNTQAGKAKCEQSGPGLSGDASITITKDADEVQASPSSGIGIGDLVTIGASAADSNGQLGSELKFDATDGAGTHEYTLHTSCSKALDLGDRFGAFEVVALDLAGVGLVSIGGLVEYQYTITSPAPPNLSPVMITSVNDSELMELLAPEMITLIPGEQRMLFATTTLTETTENTVTVSGTGGAFGDVQCSDATDTATVVVVPPPPPGPEDFDCSDAKPIQTLSLIWSGPTGTDLVSEGGQVINNLQNGQLYVLTVASLGNDVDVDLAFPDGTTGKSRFHVSCSDRDMNGAEDCDKLAGNSKDDRPELENAWIFRGMAGDLALVCPDTP